MPSTAAAAPDRIRRMDHGQRPDRRLLRPARLLARRSASHRSGRPPPFNRYVNFSRRRGSQASPSTPTSPSETVSVEEFVE